MVNKETQISLTYTLGGESLVKAGVYQTAEVKVTNGFTKKEIFKVVKPMQTIKQAEYSKATKEVTLNNSFVQNCLERPVKPKDKPFSMWTREPIGKAFLDWNKLSEEQKIKAHIEQYVLDMGGEEFSYKIL